MSPAIREKFHLGYPHFSNKFTQIQFTLCIQKLATVFGGPESWKILCLNYICWWSDLLKTMWSYVLVVCGVSLGWDPLLYASFKVVVEQVALFVPGHSQQCCSYGYITYRRLFCSDAEYNHTMLDYTVAMDILNVQPRQRQVYHIWVELCYFMSVSNKLSYLIASIMLLSQDRVIIIFTVKFVLITMLSP